MKFYSTKTNDNASPRLHPPRFSRRIARTCSCGCQPLQPLLLRLLLGSGCSALFGFAAQVPPEPASLPVHPGRLCLRHERLVQRAPLPLRATLDSALLRPAVRFLRSSRAFARTGITVTLRRRGRASSGPNAAPRSQSARPRRGDTSLHYVQGTYLLRHYPVRPLHRVETGGRRVRAGL